MTWGKSKMSRTTIILYKNYLSDRSYENKKNAKKAEKALI